jgi:hypothetical protein
MERVVEVGDQPVLLSGAEGRRAVALERLLGRMPISHASPKLTIQYLAEGPELPARPPDARTLQIELWFEGEGLLARERSGISAEVSGDEVWFGGASLDPTAALHRLVQVVLTHALFRCDRFVLHAGAIEQEGRAWLLLGGSGMGKSTLAFAALNAAWRVLSDDIVILRRSEQGFEVAGLIARPFVVPRELLEALEEQGEPVIGDVRQRHVLTDVSPQPGWTALGGCLLVAHADGPEGNLTRVEPSSSLAGLLLSFVGSINPRLLPSFFGAACILARYPSFQLTQGRDPSARLLGAQACLAELAGSAEVASADHAETQRDLWI